MTPIYLSLVILSLGIVSMISYIVYKTIKSEKSAKEFRESTNLELRVVLG